MTHGYLAMDLDTVWEVIRQNLPQLDDAMRGMRARLPATSEPAREKPDNPLARSSRSSDDLIERALLGLPLPAGIVICMLIATFLLGFFLDWLELTLIILPLVGPVVAALEFAPVWFTVMFAVCLQTSFLTPPVGGRAISLADCHLAQSVTSIPAGHRRQADPV